MRMSHSGMGMRAYTLLGTLLHQVTTVVGSFGNLDDEVHLAGKSGYPFEKLFELLAVHLIELAPATGRNQEEDLPKNRLQIAYKRCHLVEMLPVVTAKRRIDLNWQPYLVCVIYSPKCELESPRNLTEAVVDFSGWPIQAHRHLRQPGFFETGH
jgi:hypothetical protein